MPHFFERHRNLREHIDAMASSTEFGDTLEVCTIAYLAKTHVHIIQRQGLDYKLVQKIPNNWYCNKQPILLLYTPETCNSLGGMKQAGHYQALINKTCTVDRCAIDSKIVFGEPDVRECSRESVLLYDIIDSLNPLDSQSR